jgi:hypothetical protein
MEDLAEDLEIDFFERHEVISIMAGNEVLCTSDMAGFKERNLI